MLKAARMHVASYALLGCIFYGVERANFWEISKSKNVTRSDI